MRLIEALRNGEWRTLHSRQKLESLETLTLPGHRS